MRSLFQKSSLINILFGVLLVTYGWRIYLDETTSSKPGRLYYVGTLCCWVAIVWLLSRRKSGA